MPYNEARSSSRVSGQAPLRDEQVELLLDNLVSFTNGILKQADSSSPHIREAFIALLETADRAARMFYICHIGDTKGFDEAVWWMSERGNATDLKVLKERRSELEATSQSRAELLKVAEEALEKRLEDERDAMGILSRRCLIGILLVTILFSGLVSMALSRPHQASIFASVSLAISMIMGFGSSVLLFVRGIDARRNVASQVFLLAAGMVMLLETTYVIRSVVYH